jgi:hypothetical protein
VVTNGSAPLANGTHTITARQSFRLDPARDTGSLSGFIDVPDNLSSTMQITIGNDYHNPGVAQDADANGSVQPLDVLVIINYINSHPNVTTPLGTSFYVDVSNDGIVSALDVLQVINLLNTQPGLVTSGMSEPAVDTGLTAQGLAAPALESLPSELQPVSEDLTIDLDGLRSTAVTDRADYFAADSFAAQSSDDGIGRSSADPTSLDELIELLASDR